MAHSLFERPPGLKSVTPTELHRSCAESLNKLKAQPYLPLHRLHRSNRASKMGEGESTSALGTGEMEGTDVESQKGTQLAPLNLSEYYSVLELTDGMWQGKPITAHHSAAALYLT